MARIDTGPLGQELSGRDRYTAAVSVWGCCSLGQGAGEDNSARAEAPQEQTETVAERMYVQMDGIFARLRGMQGKGSDFWRELKVGAVFWAEAGQHASKLAELVGKAEAAGAETVRVWVDRPKGPVTYVAGIILAADFGIRLYAEAVARGLERAKEVVILSDGAIWIWKLAEEHFPEAIQILDFWHAKERIWTVAYAVWGQSSVKAKKWAEAQIENHLVQGDVAGLVAAIGKLPKIAPPPGQKKSIPEQAMEYFQNNAERMHYPEYRAQGLDSYSA